MEKSSKIYLLITIVCAVLVVGLCVFVIANHKEVKLTDGQKFKEEYESYNNGKYEENNKKLFKVSIDEDNPMIYKTGKEILDVLNKEKAYVFFGFATDPNTRNVIETLLESAKEEDVDKIYYVDIESMRDEYEFDGSIIPKQTAKGTDAYYKILDFFGTKLEKYFVPDKNGNLYSTSVTRLETATLIAVDNHKIKDMHVGTNENHTDIFKKLSNEEKESLEDIYENLFESIKKD